MDANVQEHISVFCFGIERASQSTGQPVTRRQSANILYLNQNECFQLSFEWIIVVARVREAIEYLCNAFHRKASASAATIVSSLFELIADCVMTFHFIACHGNCCSSENRPATAPVNYSSGQPIGIAFALLRRAQPIDSIVFEDFWRKMDGVQHFDNLSVNCECANVKASVTHFQTQGVTAHLSINHRSMTKGKLIGASKFFKRFAITAIQLTIITRKQNAQLDAN